MIDEEIDLVKIFKFLKKNIILFIPITLIIYIIFFIFADQIKKTKYLDTAIFQFMITPLITKDENKFTSLNLSVDELDTFTSLIQKAVFNKSISNMLPDGSIDGMTTRRSSEKIVNKQKLYDMFLEYLYFPEEVESDIFTDELMSEIWSWKIIQTKKNRAFIVIVEVPISIFNFDKEIIKIKKILKIVNKKVFSDIQNEINEKILLTGNRIDSLEIAFGKDLKNNQEIRDLLVSNRNLFNILSSDISDSILFLNNDYTAVNYNLDDYVVKKNIIAGSFFLVAFFVSIILSACITLPITFLKTYNRK